VLYSASVIHLPTNIQTLDEHGFYLVIPIFERRDFVEHLQRMNINPFSLFESEDSLMEDIYLSEMFLRKRL